MRRAPTATVRSRSASGEATAGPSPRTQRSFAPAAAGSAAAAPRTSGRSAALRPRGGSAGIVGRGSGKKGALGAPRALQKTKPGEAACPPAPKFEIPQRLQVEGVAEREADREHVTA